MRSRTIERITGGRSARALRRLGLAMALSAGAALTVPSLVGTASAAGSWSPPASPSTSAPFNECPAAGGDTGCAVLIVLNSDGTVTIKTDNNQDPYDGSDDTLVGVLNNSGFPLSSIVLSSPSLDIFGFDGDGVCSNGFKNTWEVSGSDVTNSCPYGSTGYEGPNTSYSNISGNKQSGTVNFTNGLANGANLFFSLENKLNGASFSIPTLTSLNTNRSASTVAFGDSVTDTATAVGSTGVPVTPAGTVSFYVCGPGSSTCSSTANQIGSAVPLTGSSGTATAQSASFSPSSVGTYCFFAVYSGTNYLTANDPGNSTNNECFTVVPAGTLVITASSATITQGSNPPPVTPTFSGVKDGDTATSLASATTQPTCSTTANSASTPGTYPSNCSGAVDSNYSSIIYVPGTVTVNPVAATAAASSPPPAAPIAKATTVHTGQPWAGSRPYALVLGAGGLSLLGLGLVRRRRFTGILEK
jgi:hypothetical protein